MGLKDITDDRLKIWLGFWQTIVISGAVAIVLTVAPALISSQIQNRELEIKSREEATRLEIATNKSNSDIAIEQARLDSELKEKLIDQEIEYVMKFLDKATSQNPEERYRLTFTLHSLTLDPNYKEGWGILLTEAKREREAKQAELNEKLAAVESAPDEKKGTLNIEIAKLQQELTLRPRTQSEGVFGEFFQDRVDKGWQIRGVPGAFFHYNIGDVNIIEIYNKDKFYRTSDQMNAMTDLNLAYLNGDVLLVRNMVDSAKELFDENAAGSREAIDVYFNWTLRNDPS